MNIVQTHSAFRIGDNLLALQLLRALAKKYPDRHFRHAVALNYLPQLIEVVADLPNLQLVELHAHKGKSWNTWKNAENFWETHPLKNDYAAFALEWARWFCPQMGLESPWKFPADLVFDYPCLEKKYIPANVAPFDVLIVNSPPCSSQWSDYDPVALNTLCQSLAQCNKVITTHPTGLNIPCTMDWGFTVTQIGHLSQLCRHIVMVSTGPSWPTFNIWNRETIALRVVFYTHETVALAPNTEQCRTVSEARRVLAIRGLL